MNDASLVTATARTRARRRGRVARVPSRSQNERKDGRIGSPRGPRRRVRSKSKLRSGRCCHQPLRKRAPPANRPRAPPRNPRADLSQPRAGPRHITPHTCYRRNGLPKEPGRFNKLLAVDGPPRGSAGSESIRARRIRPARLTTTGQVAARRARRPVAQDPRRPKAPEIPNAHTVAPDSSPRRETPRRTKTRRVATKVREPRSTRADPKVPAAHAQDVSPRRQRPVKAADCPGGLGEPSIPRGDVGLAPTHGGREGQGRARRSSNPKRTKNTDVTTCAPRPKRDWKPNTGAHPWCSTSTRRCLTRRPDTSAKAPRPSEAEARLRSRKPNPHRPKPQERSVPSRTHALVASPKHPEVPPVSPPRAAPHSPESQLDRAAPPPNDAG